MVGYPAIPASRNYQKDRNFEFVPGYLTSRLPNHPQGYTLRYNAVTKRGMSGGLVFDGERRVVGIHGQGALDFLTDNQGNIVDKLTTKTGLNAAIPINTFLAKLSEAGLNRSAIWVNTSTAANAPLKLNTVQLRLKPL